MCAMSSDKDKVAHDPAALERQADEIRANMDRTLGALERKFSPEQLIDRSLGYFREHGGELRQTLGATMRNNPIPIALTLAGITWLVASSYNARQPPGQDLRSRFSRSGVGQKLQARAQSARERVQSATQAARERFHSGSEKESELGELGADGAHHEECSHRSRRRYSDAWHTARDRAQERAREVQDRVYTMIDEQPLVLGALAVAVGAIIGAAIPSTRYEDRVLGRARDHTLSKAQELGERQYENLKEGMQGASQAPDASGTLSGRA